MNLFSDEMRRNPYPLYEQFRATSPLLYLPPLDVWMIFDYEGVRRALNDPHVFSSSIGAPEWLIFQDPPRHTKLRALISQAFTPRSIASLEPRIRELSRELLDRSLERGEMDLAADYSVILPLVVIADMIGIPDEDREPLKRWNDSILKLSLDFFGGEDASQALTEFRDVTAEMSDYVAGLIGQRRRHPKDDLLTRLVHAEVDGEQLTHLEILNFFQLLLVGGQETTTNLINNAIISFIENPEQLARLRAEPELMPSAIEEVLRYRSPFQWTARATKCDVDWQGQKIPAGKRVVLVMGSANRDARHFHDPNRFDIARHPNPHLAFGHGIHSCLGAPLSRMEARIALSDLLSGMKTFGFATDDPWEPRAGLNVHGPTRLPIRFERALFNPQLTSGVDSTATIT